MTARVSLRLLGKPSVFYPDGNAIAGLPKKAFFVAALIAQDSAPSISKPRLGELLWLELTPPQRANNLRQLLFRVRQFEIEHGLQIFVTRPRQVALSNDIDCDLLAFRDLSRRGGADLEPLMKVYSGRLLEEAPSDGQSLNLWVNDQRLQLEDQFVDLALAAVEGLSPGERRTALGRVIELAPSAIPPRKALMWQLAGDGHVQDARRQYREIQHIGGHGTVAAPPGLLADPVPAQPKQHARRGMPLSQIGRDEAGVPHLALLAPKGSSAAAPALLLAEGLVDDVTVALTRLRSVSVLAPHSARKIANSEDPGGTAMARVDFVLRTKVLPAGSRGNAGAPQITLLLERAASGDVVWGERLALDPDTAPEKFAAIANAIALTLVDHVERATLRAFQVPADAGAYGHYLLGQRALQVLELQSTRRARASFKAALALSPFFAPAHTGYAQSLIYEWVIRGQGDAELVARARDAAERARDIDPQFGSAHQMLGRASLFEGDFAAGLAHFEQAEALNPHHADLLCDFADTLMHSSLPQRANDKIELALTLNPLAPDAYWWASAGIKFFVGDYDGALDHLNKVKNSEPVLRLTAACAAMAGQHELAKTARNKFLAIDPGFKLDDWIGVLPVRDPSHRRQYRQALQKAGFK